MSIKFNMSGKEITELEDDLRDLSHYVLEIAGFSREKKSNSLCDGDLVIQDCYNCNNLINYQGDRLGTLFNKCLTDAYNEGTIRKCIDRYTHKIKYLEKKLRTSKACNKVMGCDKNVGIINPKTIYCFSHTQTGTGEKCMSKLKNNTLKDMSHNEINFMIGGPPGKR